MEQRVFNLTQPTVTTAPAETASKPKRKVNRKSPKRKMVLKYIRENPLADVHEVARVCQCSTNYVYHISPRSKLKHKLGHQQLKKAAKPMKKTPKAEPKPAKTDDWGDFIETALDSLPSAEPAFGIAEASTMQVGGDHYRTMQVQPWDALKSWLTPAEYRGYQKGTAISYLARERSKGGDIDIRKAAHHLMKLAEDLSNSGE
jgi:transposase